MTAQNYFSAEYTSAPKKQANIKGVPYTTFKGHYFYDVSEANANDTFVLAQGLDGNTIVKSIIARTEALTAATDNDIMICKHGQTSGVTPATGKSNLLVDGKTLASALAGVDILGSGLSSFDFSKSLSEITGVENETFDLVLIVKTAGTTTDANLCFEVEYCDNL
ncbi:hypothetical protein J5751_04860 [bacterium]|nr:hypothetical protein [bacterium]